MTRHPFAALLPLLALLSCATMTHPQTGFLDRSVIVGGHRYPYVVYVPRDYDPAKRLPVVLFLHGSGERGSDGLKQTQIGLGAAMRANAAPLDVIAVFPQCPENQRWLGGPASAAMMALDAAMSEFHADEHRVYATGLSMGGYGVWHLALAHPRRFAALVVVCGGLLPHPTTNAVARSPLTENASDPYAFVASELKETPVWIFHGDDDKVVPVEESRRMDAALRRSGAPDVHYTEYAGVGHNSWERAFREPGLWTWLMAQRR